jgi:hypothetical protein
MQKADAILDIYQKRVQTMDRLYEWFTGEPDAMKVASPVRREAVGKVLHSCSNSLAAHPTVKGTR